MRLTSLVCVSASVLSMFLGVPVLAQEDPINTSRRGRFDQPDNNYADVWGDGDHAYVAHSGEPFVDIVDVSDPDNPTLVATYDAGGGGFFGPSAQDVKVADGLMYVGLESSEVGVHIVDVRNPAEPVKLTEVRARPNIHNLFYADGWLYLADSFAPEVDLIDLRDYDPDRAPAVIDDATFTLSGVGAFVHDVTVQHGRLYAAAWSSLRVYDVSDLPNTPPQLLGTAGGSSVHSSWATDDGQFVVTAEERSGGGLTLFAVVENGGGVDLVLLDEFSVDNDLASSVHNPVILGDHIYTAWYELGLVVVRIDRATGTLVPRALFDTTALDGTNSFFGGCWGVYPFLGRDRVLASDRSNGLWVVQVGP